MKKVMSILLVMTMLAAVLSGCAGGGQEEVQPAGPENQQAEQPAETAPEQLAADGGASADDGKLKLGWTKQVSTEYYTELEGYIEAAVAEEFGAENVEWVGWFDGEGDVQTQLDQIQVFVTEGVDAILACPISPAMTEEILNIAGDTPVIFVNMHPDHDLLEKNRHTFIGSNELEGGHYEGLYAGNELKRRGIDVANLVVLMGDLGNINVTNRTQGAKDGLAEAGIEVNLVAEESGNFDRARGMDITTQLLGAGKDINCIIANNDDMALGAVEALKAVGRLDEVVVCGLDGTLNAYYSIRDGEMLMTARQEMANEGEGIANILRSLSNGEDIELEYLLPYEVVTIDNAGEFIERAENKE